MIARLFRRFILLLPFAIAAAWLAERWLRERSGDAMPRAIRSTVMVDAPIERTWAALADIEGQPAWMHDLKWVRILTPGPVSEGTEALGHVRILGLGVADPVRITTFEPPGRFCISHEGFFRGSGEITLEPRTGGATTTVTWDETLLAPALPHLAAIVMRPVLARVFADDLGRFAALVESGAPAAPANA